MYDDIISLPLSLPESHFQLQDTNSFISWSTNRDYLVIDVSLTEEFLKKGLENVGNQCHVRALLELVINFGNMLPED